jgi:hypothetical protein
MKIVGLRWPQPVLQRLPSPWNPVHVQRRALTTPRPARPSGLALAEIQQRIDDRIRRTFREESPDVVEEVVRARQEIWGGLHGGKSALVSELGRTDQG